MINVRGLLEMIYVAFSLVDKEIKSEHGHRKIHEEYCILRLLSSILWGLEVIVPGNRQNKFGRIYQVR